MHFTETRLLNLDYRYKLLGANKHDSGKVSFISTLSITKIKSIKSGVSKPDKHSQF